MVICCLVLVNYVGGFVKEAIANTVEYFGSQAEMAKALGVSRAAVSHWLRDEAFPPARAIQIEIMSEGLIKALDLVAK